MIDNDGCPRIADFGLAKIGPELYDEGPDAYDGQGSLRWQAPELLLPGMFGGDGRHSTASDVYAFGMTCLEVRMDLVGQM